MFSVGIGKLDRRSGGTDTPIDQHATGPTHEPADTPEPSAKGGNVAAPRPSWLRVLAAPAVALLRPGAAAGCLATASRPAFAAVFVLGLLGYAAVLIGLMLWEATVEGRWVYRSPPVASGPATTPSGTLFMPPGSWQVNERSIAEVWRDWHAGTGWFGPAELTLALVLVLGTVALAFLGWLNLPRVHRAGSVWRSGTRSLRAVTPIVGPVTFATFAFGAVLIMNEHGVYRAGNFFGIDEGLVFFAAIAVTLWLLVWWLRAAARGVERGEPLLALPPRCEGCGYNLTHQPADRRCPECGLDIAASLVARCSRPGSPWSHGIGAGSWCRTTSGVLFRPKAFYRALRLLTPDGAEAGFASLSYVLIGVTAVVWIAVLGFLEAPPLELARLMDRLAETATYIVCFVLCGLLGCWLGHRTIAALVFSWWLVRHELPDFRWAHKVAVYETVFLWVFCIFWGTLATSFIVFGWWVSDPFGAALGLWFIFGLPAEAWLVLLGTLVLAVLWLWRYEIAYRAIRWGNF